MPRAADDHAYTVSVAEARARFSELLDMVDSLSPHRLGRSLARDAQRGALLMLHLDPSLLIAALTTEERSERARNWIIAAHEPLVTSAWAMTEAASALSLEQRRRGLGTVTRAVAERSLARLVDEALEVVPVLQLPTMGETTP